MSARNGRWALAGDAALFLDRDGVVNKEREYVHRKDDFEFIDGVFEACRAAIGLGYKLVIITNQAGIARGLYSETDFHALTEWMLGRFSEDLSALQRAIRLGDGEMLQQFFTRTRAIRKGVIDAGQDTARPDFGRITKNGRQDEE